MANITRSLECFWVAQTIQGRMRKCTWCKKQATKTTRNRGQMWTESANLDVLKLKIKHIYVTDNRKTEYEKGKT